MIEVDQFCYICFYVCHKNIVHDLLAIPRYHYYPHIVLRCNNDRILATLRDIVNITSISICFIIPLLKCFPIIYIAKVDSIWWSGHICVKTFHLILLCIPRRGPLSNYSPRSLDNWPVSSFRYLIFHLLVNHQSCPDYMRWRRCECYRFWQIKGSSFSCCSQTPPP